MGYKNNKCGIYKIYFIDYDKVYIGLTKGFSSRRVQHLRSLEQNKHFNIHLQRAFNKYGKDNLRIELIEECDASELAKKEKYYIEMYDSFKNGFNLTTGGEECNVAEDVKKRISEKHMGKIIKPETRQKLRDINLGKKHSQEAKDKISRLNSARIFTSEQKEKMSKGASYKRSKEVIEKMSNRMIGSKVSDMAKLKLAAHNLKRTRPNSLIEIKDGKVYIDGYEYVKGKRTPPEQELFEKEKAIRIANGNKKRSISLTGKKRTLEQRAKISKGLKGLKRTPEQNLANSLRQKGKKQSEEFRQKLRDYNKRKKEKLWVASQLLW